MTSTPTPSEAAYIAAQQSYIAAQQALEAGQVITSQVQVVAVLAAIVVGGVALLLWRRKIKAQAKCGPHTFCQRADQLFDTETNKWRTIYVRDVCTHCGEAREREREREE